jgi:hypothetical protein
VEKVAVFIDTAEGDGMLLLNIRKRLFDYTVSPLKEIIFPVAAENTKVSRASHFQFFPTM